MDITIPELGESITEGTISAWMKKVGDPVKFGDLLLELETDKVNLEVSAQADGILESIDRQAGDTVQVGETVGRIRSGQAAGKAAGGEGEREREQPEEAAAGNGDRDVSASKPARDNARQAPHTEEGPLKVHTDNNISSGGGVPDHDAASPEQSGDAAYVAPPSVRKFARERGVDLNEVRAAKLMETDRISKADLRDYLSKTAPGTERPREPEERHGEPRAGERPGKAAASERAAAEFAKPVERKRMSRRRLTIANRLVEAQRTAAMLTTFNEVDMTAIIDIRKRRKQSFMDKHDVGLGFMSFFTKAVVGALKSFPLLNAEIDGEEILVKKYYDIGIAVAAKEGLVVPVVREADRLSFAEIEKRIAELASKAGSNTLALSDLQGGTFTITNGGVFGSLLSTPILNTPQVGILGMHTIQRRPVAIDEDRMENRPMMYIALSYDHRIVDGSEAVRFLVTVKQLLEDPESLLLEG